MMLSESQLNEFSIIDSKIMSYHPNFKFFLFILAFLQKILKKIKIREVKLITSPYLSRYSNNIRDS